jgi:hypothetical protein
MMQMIKLALTMSIEQREAFQRAERQLARRHVLVQSYRADAEARVSAAEAKRARRRERNLAQLRP